jgi:ferredoxin-NADP reductase
LDAIAEVGARPNVPPLQRRILRAVRSFSFPLLPDDYLELINPLWSSRELRGRIERIVPETDEASTIFIKPGYDWDGHEPGQYLRIGVDIQGVRHWRAYSLTSAAGREDGLISITVKNVEEGKVSHYLVREGRPGTVVSLGGVEGEFVLPDPLPEKMLFVSAGSGVTPIMSMLRSLSKRDEMNDVILVHSAPGEDLVIFGSELRGMADQHEGFRLHEQHTKTGGRIGPDSLDELCPDWREREVFLSGPGEMLDTMIEHWEAEADSDRVHFERFQPKTGDFKEGEGGTITFKRRGQDDCVVECDGSTPIMIAGEDAGLDMPFGCREGICHTCVCTLKDGRIRDLRSGDVSGEKSSKIRTCINGPEGPIEIHIEES